MRKLLRAGAEALLTIVITLAAPGIAFGTLFGYDDLVALAGIFYISWAAVILAIHLGLAHKRRHHRLSVSIGASVAIMIVHLAMFLAGMIDVDLNIVPVILHDFGFALVALVALTLVHMVLFRRKGSRVASARDRLAGPAAGGTPRVEEPKEREDAQA